VCQRKGMASNDIETQFGPWKLFTLKSNDVEVQGLVVPWFIAMYRLNYSKSLKLNVIKQVVMQDILLLKKYKPSYTLVYSDIL
jgi:hypothetical protein